MIGHTMFLARHATQKVVGGRGRCAVASTLLRRYVGPVRRGPKPSGLCSGLSNIGKRSITHPSHIRNSSTKHSKAKLQAVAGGVLLCCGGVLYAVDETSSSEGNYYSSRWGVASSRRTSVITAAEPRMVGRTGKVRTKRLAQYTFIGTLGRGSFGVVRSAVDPKQEKIRHKRTRFKAGERCSSKYEIQVLKLLSNGSENLCSLHEVIEKKDKIYLIFDYIDGIALDNLLVEGALGEEAAREIAIDMLNALSYIHQRGIIHRDLKPENILIRKTTETQNGASALIDFGMGVICNKNHNKHLAVKPKAGDAEGTFEFWAPEMMKRDTYGPAVDLWALGVSLYCILCGTHPFDTNGKSLHEDIYRSVVSGNFNQDNKIWKSKLSGESKDFISKLLNVDSFQRMSCEEALKHPWLLKR